MKCVRPADQVDNSVKLQAINGATFPCYGKRSLEIKFRRKVYIVEAAVIAKVKSPVLGWDFIRKCKFDWIWGEFGDLYFLRDRVAGISKRLEHVAIAHNYLPRLSKDLPTVGS